MSKAEKFISEYTRNCSNLVYKDSINEKEFNIYNEWLTPSEARKAVEIASEEMIERACEYLDGLIEILNDRGHQLKKEHIIDGLKQAIKDE